MDRHRSTSKQQATEAHIPKTEFQEKCEENSMFLFIFSIIVPPIILAIQSLFWLKTGAWPSWTLSSILSFFPVNLNPVFHPTDFQGLAYIAQHILTTPLAWATFFGLMATGWILSYFGEN